MGGIKTQLLHVLYFGYLKNFFTEQGLFTEQSCFNTANIISTNESLFF
jgi:hypothetical protein